MGLRGRGLITRKGVARLPGVVPGGCWVAGRGSLDSKVGIAR